MGPDLVGYIASGLVLLTFTAKSMLTLRILGILSNFAFICYGIIDAITPVLCLHAVLLPLNIARLVQILACGERPQIGFQFGWRAANEAKPLGRDLDDREPGRAYASSLVRLLRLLDRWQEGERHRRQLATMFPQQCFRLIGGFHLISPGGNHRQAGRP
jgi:hypothetical protein